MSLPAVPGLIVDDDKDELGVRPDADAAARHRRPVFREVDVAGRQPGAQAELAALQLVERNIPGAVSPARIR